MDLAFLYRQMARARAYELAVEDLWNRGLISGEMHLGTGEEAVAAGVVTHLEDGDGRGAEAGVGEGAAGGVDRVDRGPRGEAGLEKEVGHPDRERGADEEPEAHAVGRLLDPRPLVVPVLAVVLVEPQDVGPQDVAALRAAGQGVTGGSGEEGLELGVGTRQGALGGAIAREPAISCSVSMFWVTST